MSEINLLLVDDDQDVLDEWKEHFHQDRFHVYDTKTGEGALEILGDIKKSQKRPIVAVLLDIQLEGDGLNGLEVLQRIKDELPFSKVYVITGNPKLEDTPSTAYLTGMYDGDGFFDKADMDFDLLKQQIEKGIEEQRIQLSLGDKP